MYGQLIRSAQADIKAHTGREVLVGSLDGFTYQKKWANGMTGKLTITHAIANQRYAYELDTLRRCHGKWQHSILTKKGFL